MRRLIRGHFNLPLQDLHAIGVPSVIKPNEHIEGQDLLHRVVWGANPHRRPPDPWRQRASMIRLLAPPMTSVIPVGRVVVVRALQVDVTTDGSKVLLVKGQIGGAADHVSPRSAFGAVDGHVAGSPRMRTETVPEGLGALFRFCWRRRPA